MDPLLIVIMLSVLLVTSLVWTRSVILNLAIVALSVGLWSNTDNAPWLQAGAVIIMLWAIVDTIQSLLGKDQ